MPTVFEQTIQALNFDPYADDIFDTRLPEGLYPSSITSFIDYLGSEGGAAVDPERGGELVRGVDTDSAPVAQSGEADSI